MYEKVHGPLTFVCNVGLIYPVQKDKASYVVLILSGSIDMTFNTLFYFSICCCSILFFPKIFVKSRFTVFPQSSLRDNYHKWSTVDA